MISRVMIPEHVEVAEQFTAAEHPRPPFLAEDGRELAKVAAVAAAIAEHNRRVQVVNLAAPCGDRDSGLPSWRRATQFGVS